MAPYECAQSIYGAVSDAASSTACNSLAAVTAVRMGVADVLGRGSLWPRPERSYRRVRKEGEISRDIGPQDVDTSPAPGKTTMSGLLGCWRGGPEMET